MSSTLTASFHIVSCSGLLKQSMKKNKIPHYFVIILMEKKCYKSTHDWTTAYSVETKHKNTATFIFFPYCLSNVPFICDIFWNEKFNLRYL